MSAAYHSDPIRTFSTALCCSHFTLRWISCLTMVMSLVLQEYPEQQKDSATSINENLLSNVVVVPLNANCNLSNISESRKRSSTPIPPSPTSSSFSIFTPQLPISTFTNLFLPVGYPSTVRDGYTDYQIFDSLQGLCSYLRGVVTSAHVLQAAGVGNASATAWSAAVTWAWKDGVGLVGGLIFAAQAAPLFDGYVKEFRFFADLINNVALFLDMMAPLVVETFSSSPNAYLYVAAMSTVCKTLCGMSAGATKGSITQHFAIAGNLADLHAKEGTQETLVSLIGMILGIRLASYFSSLEKAVENDPAQLSYAFRLQWTVFMVLTAIHVWANYQAVQLIRLRTLNRQRTTEVLLGLCESMDLTMTVDNETLDKIVQEKVPKPTDVQESLAWSTWQMLLPNSLSKLVLGAPLLELLSEHSAKSSDQLELLQEFQKQAYVLTISGTGRIFTSLSTKATVQTEMSAMVHAILLQYWWKQTQKVERNVSERFGAIQLTHRTVQSLFPKLWNRFGEQMWEMERLYLGYSNRRSQWSIQEENNKKEN